MFVFIGSTNDDSALTGMVSNIMLTLELLHTVTIII